MANTKSSTKKAAMKEKEITTSQKKASIGGPTKTSNRKKTTGKRSSVQPKSIEIKKLDSKGQYNNNNNKKKTNTMLTMIGIVALVAVAILIFRFTYAYFTAMVKDKNPDHTDATVQTADLQVRYQDGSSNLEIGEKILPGVIITKEFSVLNEGNDSGLFAIVLENVKHNLGHENNSTLISDVKYTLVKIDKNNNETTVGTGTLPFNATQYIIYNQDKVKYQETNKYKLYIEYINHSNIDQSDSMGEKLELKVNIINVIDEQRTQDTEY